MRVFRSVGELPSDFGPSIASVGNFDGVHLGHRSVLRQIGARARDRNAKAVAVTFDPHPTRVLRPQAAPKLITPLDAKLALLESSGVDAVLVVPFTRDLSLLTPRDFAESVLARALGAIEVHEGDNFHFGHKAEGNVTRLAEFGRELGFEVVVYPMLRAHGEQVSSSNIRRLIAEGRITRARQLLGRAFSIVAPPGRGRGLGHKYTVPTINLSRYDELVPANGVYVTSTRVSGENFQSVTNVGVRPTFGEDSFAIETHLLDFRPIELTADTPVEITFLKHLREEIKWPDTESLRRQIARDVARARRYFHWTAPRADTTRQARP